MEFQKYIKEINQQELFDKYLIQAGKQFRLKDIVEMLNNYNLNQQERKILNNQIIEKYCQYQEIQINYNITPEYQDWKCERTIAIWLAFKYFIPPKEWHHNPILQDTFQQTVAIILSHNGIIPSKEWEHDPSIADRGRYTVALSLARNRQIPPIQWCCINNGVCRRYKTIQQLLQQTQIQVPQYWIYDNIDSNENTKEMLQAENGIIPDIGDNDPIQSNNANETVAIILAKQGIIPPKEWMHDIDMKNAFGMSIKSLLLKNYLPVPHYWHDNDMTIFDKACYGIIPSIQGHNSEEQNEDGQTIAMILTQIGIEVPEEWYHKPELCDNNGNTVGIMRARKCYAPLQQWIHDIDYKNKQGQSIRSLYYQNEYIFMDNQFIINCQTQMLDDVCQICYNNGEQKFVVTNCGHKICFWCFQQMLQVKSQVLCPICRQLHWYQKIQKEDIQQIQD